MRRSLGPLAMSANLGMVEVLLLGGKKKQRGRWYEKWPLPCTRRDKIYGAPLSWRMARIVGLRETSLVSVLGNNVLKSSRGLKIIYENFPFPSGLLP